jgi:hypothetical protein
LVLTSLLLILQGGLADDARFSAPVDFDLSLCQITDLCKTASLKTNVDLSVAKDVQDLKIDAFVEGKPVSETLDKVAKALNCDWVPVGKGYRLEMSVPNTNRERNFNLAEDAEARHIAETKLWACEYCANLVPGSNKQISYGESLIPSASRNAIIAPFERAYEATMKGNNLEDQTEAQLKYSAISDAAGSLDHINIGHVMLQMNRSAKEAFWKGEPVMAGSIPGNGYKLWPSDSLAPSKTLFTSGQLVTKAEDTNFDFLLFDPLTSKLNIHLNSYSVSENEFGPSEVGMSHGGPFTGSSSRNEIPEKLKKLPFYQDLKPWLDESGTQAKFPQTVNPDTEEWPSPWFTSRRRLGDHLRWLHRATGIPIVAQADRSCIWDWISLKRPYKTASEYLKGLVDEFEVYCREDHGFLLARNYRFWSHRRHEAPESVWRKLAPKPGDGSMDVNRYAAYTSEVREDQMQTVDLGYPLCEVDLSKANFCYNMLRFYGTLTDGQRQTARQEAGLGAEDMSGTQQAEMISLLKKTIFKSGGCSAGMAKYLFTTGLDSSTMQQMRLHVGESGFRPSSNFVEELKDNGVIVRPSSTVNAVASQIMFTFKLNKGQSVYQVISIDK